MHPTITPEIRIIGGRAAGLSAALVLGRARRVVLVRCAALPAQVGGELTREGLLRVSE